MTVKEKWSAPICEKVKLVAEEAVLAGCKTATQAVGSGRPNCNANQNGCRTVTS